VIEVNLNRSGGRPVARRGEEYEFKVWHGIGCLLFLLIGGFGGCAMAASYKVSDGVRLGVINKFTKHGYVWKTWEGEIACTGLTAGTASGANVWDFSIDHDTSAKDEEALAAKFNELAEKGDRVKIHFIQVFHGWPWRGETDYYATSVEDCAETAKTPTKAAEPNRDGEKK
jgi:hypothetical protein